MFLLLLLLPIILFIFFLPCRLTYAYIYGFSSYVRLVNIIDKTDKPDFN